MPWKMSDAISHTKRASTPAKARQWASVANSILQQSGNEGKAVRIANSAVKNTPAKVTKVAKAKRVSKK